MSLQLIRKGAFTEWGRIKLFLYGRLSFYVQLRSFARRPFPLVAEPGDGGAVSAGTMGGAENYSGEIGGTHGLNIYEVIRIHLLTVSSRHIEHMVGFRSQPKVGDRLVKAAINIYEGLKGRIYVYGANKTMSMMPEDGKGRQL